MNETRGSLTPSAWDDWAGHAAFVRRLAAALTRNEADGADLAQEIALAAARYPGEPAGLRAWLHAVARRLQARRQRTEGRRRTHEANAVRPRFTEECTSAEAIEDLERLTAALARLDPLYSTVIVERFLRERSTAEIAGRLGLPEATVRTRLFRGIERLRRDLGIEPARPRMNGRPSPWTICLIGVSFTMKKLAVAGLLIGLLWGAYSWTHREAATPAANAEPMADGGPPDVRRTRERRTPPAATAPTVESPPASEPTGASAAAPAAIVVRLYRKADRRPLAGVPVTLEDLRGNSPTAAPQSTDAQGIVRFRSLAVSRYYVRTDRGYGAETETRAGKTAAVDLAFENAFDLRGRVIDDAGRGVPDAVIVLSHVIDLSMGTDAAVTDGDGRFAIDGLDRYSIVTAIKKGRLPSPPLAVGRAVERFADRVTLTIGGPAAAVRGFVRDDTGAAIRGAAVLIGRPKMPGDGSADDDRPAWRRVTTDETGAFAADTASPGPTPISACADGFAPKTITVDLTTDLCAAADITLDRAVTVFGRVTTGDGTPAAGAWVRTGGGDAFARAVVRTDAEGRYTLTGIPAGRSRLFAGTPGGGRATRTIDQRAGDRVLWDVTLDPGLVLAGRVTDDAGAPMADVIVTARGVDDGARGFDDSVRTDASGAFRMTQLPDAALSLSVHEAPGAMPSAVILRLRPGAADLQVIVHAADRPSAFATLDLRTPEGLSLSGATVVLTLDDSPWRSIAESDAEGHVRLGPLLGGTYSMAIIAPGRAIEIREGISIRAGADQRIE